MTPVELYEELEELRQDPEAFQYRAKALLEEYFASFPPEQSKKAREVQCRLDNELRSIVDPDDRMNKMIELFWAFSTDVAQVDQNGFQAKSQDGGEVIDLKR